MNFTIYSKTLLKELVVLNGCINNNPVIPILKNFLFELANQKLTVTASNLHITLITEINVDVEGKFQMAIPAAILLNTLKNLPEQPIRLDMNEENYEIRITSNNGRYKIIGENPADFPRENNYNQTNLFKLETEYLKKAITQTTVVASNNEFRAALTGIYLELSQNTICFVGTDIHRLVRYIRHGVQIPVEKTTMIVPKKAFLLLNGLIREDHETVRFHFDDKHIYFVLDNTVMIARLIDEQYPDYEDVIPINNSKEFVINKEDFLNSLKRVNIYTHAKTHHVTLKLSENKLNVYAKDFDFSNEASEDLSCNYQGKELEVILNIKYLIEQLSVIESEEIVFQFEDEKKAILILEKEKQLNENFLFLIMPLSMN